MPDLLLELFSEEIPARMQRTAAEHLRKKITNGVIEAGLTYEGAKAFWTPRRLALAVHGVPVKSPDLKEERKGPKVGAPEKAVAGFLRGAGLASIDEVQIQTDPKKGEFYVAVIEKPGRPTIDILADLIADTIRTFPWPKSMRWGDTIADPNAIRWVRPLTSILATFGPETEEVDIIPVSVPGYTAGRVTAGHRFHAPNLITVSRLDDYQMQLSTAKVVIDADRRKEIILNDMKDRALALGLDIVEDPGLLEEVSGLVEWPVVLVGTFDERFLELPDEVIRLTVREHQKCFVLRDPQTGSLANRFVLTSNLEATDGGEAIVGGNERVVRARLSDAAFFFETDKKTPLETWLAKLKSVVFHQKLGTQYERVERIAALASALAAITGADKSETERAARLAKADLATGMVGEFPELQGYMGRMYADAQGESASVSEAIGDHYKPLGPGDEVPTAPVAIAVSLADKLDMLTGFWAIDEKPTGSKDPYALRRAALGVIRIILENKLRLPLQALPVSVGNDLLAFLGDRLKVQLRDQGARHDLVDAVFALPGQDDLLMVVDRVNALGSFLSTDDGANLLAGTKRAANILRAEEKKDGRSFDGAVDPALLTETAEKDLNSALDTALSAAQSALDGEDFAAAMVALAGLRAPVDAFFEAILVNTDDAAVRANRLNLLNRLRQATAQVADFNRIEG